MRWGDIETPQPTWGIAYVAAGPHPQPLLPTPHIAGGAGYCHRRCFTTACADALAVLRGEEPVYAATPRDDTLYRGVAEAAAS